MLSKNLFLPDEQEMLDFGRKLATVVPHEFIIFLQGDLGAGKTTLVRGFLKGLGYSENVKSPTYTLVEPYHIHHRWIYHFDFYRINHPGELEEMGIRDYFEKSICLIEWPEKCQEYLPKADIHCYITPKNSGRSIQMESHTSRGEMVLKNV